MKKFAFSRKLRLSLRRDFQAVFAAEKKTITKDLIAWHKLGEKTRKIGLLVSKKIGGAVKRNRTKRLLREAFRLSNNNTKEGIYLIIYPKAASQINNLVQAEAALESVWRKAKLLKE